MSRGKITTSPETQLENPRDRIEEADNELAKLHGLEVDEGETEHIGLVACPRCGYQEKREAHFCSRCGQAMRVEAATRIQDMQNGVIEHALVWYRENRPKRWKTDSYLERFREQGDLESFTGAELGYIRDAVKDWGQTMGRADIEPAIEELNAELRDT